MIQIDSTLTSWIEVNKFSHFPIQNIPFGITQFQDKIFPSSRIDDYVINLQKLYELGFFSDLPIPTSAWYEKVLNPIIGLPKTTSGAIRKRIIELYSSNQHEQREILKTALIPVADTTQLLPVIIPNYTDFYSSKEHATNVGMMFRDINNPLLPNWLHIPIGYHGRASSIVVSGTPIYRPWGQIKKDDWEIPKYMPTQQLDFELEMAFITCKNTTLGSPILIEEAEDAIFGLVLFNDWSARDIQRWEYVPLGPFLGKNFGSSISPWIITLDALEPFRLNSPHQNPAPLPYLIDSKKHGFDIQLTVELSISQKTTTLATSNYKYLYWNMAQQLAHHTVNGCNICVGDLYASGTISGPTADSFGSMLELAWKGTKPITLSDGTTRTFIHDNDTIKIQGVCKNDQLTIGFGEVSGTILPAKSF